MPCISCQKITPCSSFIHAARTSPTSPFIKSGRLLNDIASSALAEHVKPMNAIPTISFMSIRQLYHSKIEVGEGLFRRRYRRPLHPSPICNMLGLRLRSTGDAGCRPPFCVGHFGRKHHRSTRPRLFRKWSGPWTAARLQQQVLQ
jgi:hypothetical protein